jgi:hypothetical protein
MADEEAIEMDRIIFAVELTFGENLSWSIVMPYGATCTLNSRACRLVRGRGLARKGRTSAVEGQVSPPLARPTRSGKLGSQTHASHFKNPPIIQDGSGLESPGQMVISTTPL